jgi:hypothetical protein
MKIFNKNKIKKYIFLLSEYIKLLKQYIYNDKIFEIYTTYKYYQDLEIIAN